MTPAQKAAILSSDNLTPTEKMWALVDGRHGIAIVEFGIEIDGDRFRHKDGHCRCPIGVLVTDERPVDGDAYKTAAHMLRVSRGWAVSFARGFDGVACNRFDEAEGHIAGSEIRRRLIEQGARLGA